MLGKIKVFYYIENQIENDDIIDEIANTAGADDWAVEVYNSEGDSIYAASSKY